MCCDAPATAGRKTAEAADGLAERNARRENVAGRKHRQVLAPHVQHRDHESHQKTALIHARSLQSLERKELLPAAPIVAEIEQDHEQLGAGESGERAVDRQIGDVFGREAGRASPGVVTTHSAARNPRATSVP